MSVTRLETLPLHEAAEVTTSPWRLAELAGDPDPEVRATVATNPSASALTLTRLGRDLDPRVRLAVLERQGLSA